MATTNLGRIGLVSRGTWSAGTYKNLDVVSYNNSLYICKVTTTTDAPTVTASWDLYVSDSGAAASAAAAASSATAAAASYDSFDDRYLGAKTSDPTVDNDGNALLTGALYWNSATGVFKVWSGSEWVTNITSNQFGTNVATFLQTPTSANLAAALTDKTGTGVAVFASNPTFPAQINLTANSGYNIYASGTAGNYLAGNLGIGDVPSATVTIDVTKEITGANAFGISSRINPDNTVSSSATGFATYAINASGITQTPTIRHFFANQGTFAGATPSLQYGFQAESSLTGATNNYGFYGGIAFATGRYNLFMAGTADNYLAGNLGIGTASPGYKLQVAGTANIAAISGTSNILIRNLSGVNRIDSYNDPITATYPFQINASQIAFYIADAEKMRVDSSGNVGIGASSFGTNAAKVIGIANGTAPTTSPAGMGQLYVEGGALKYRGSSGTVTTIAAA